MVVGECVIDRTPEPATVEDELIVKIEQRRLSIRRPNGPTIIETSICHNQLFQPASQSAKIKRAFSGSALDLSDHIRQELRALGNTAGSPVL